MIRTSLHHGKLKNKDIGIIRDVRKENNNSILKKNSYVINNNNNYL